MKTRITELFGIKYPIILSGMSFISVPKLVAAVSNAGGLGILATAPLSGAETRKAVQEIREMTDKPFGANAALLFPSAAEIVKVLLEEKVPVINFALGKGDRIVKSAHAYGGKVIATVVGSRHALSAQEYGCDAVISTGHEAAAHGDALTTFILVPTLVDALRIPVIAAGGIGDGRGLAAALVLGADGVAMGSRFMSTKESPLHETYKRLSIEKKATDTLFSARFDGLPCRILKTDAAERAIKRGFDLPASFFNSREIARQVNVPYRKLFFNVMVKGWKNAKQLAFLANAYKAFRIAIEEGDLKGGVLPIGQVTGLINDEPTVDELIERIVADAKDIQRKMTEKIC
ncbi:MAG: nitronate monooxygenase [Euryarchaeota archaeon]|nr:nitronate monooxygenase [Euryarchaeota archaeon]